MGEAEYARGSSSCAAAGIALSSASRKDRERTVFTR